MTITAGAATLFPVKTLAGDVINLQSKAEGDFYTQARDRYMAENKFTVASDLRALDRLIFFETLVYRWQTQLASGKNLDGAFLTDREEDSLRKNLKETAPLLSQIQSDLGLTKSQREKDQYESVGAYIVRLQQAAKEHGIRRERQLGKAIELTKELFSLASAYQRSSQKEREKLGLESAEDIITWILDYMKPEFDAVDDHFRKNQQRFWLRQI